MFSSQKMFSFIAAHLLLLSLLMCNAEEEVKKGEGEKVSNSGPILNAADIVAVKNAIDAKKSEKLMSGGQCCSGGASSGTVQFYQQISNLPVSDLLLNYVDDYEDEPSFLMNRFGEEEEERSPAVTPKAANCIPELQTIQLVNSTDPTVVYLPTCTRIERCGGCCSHNLLTCEATDTESASFKVIKTQFTPGNRLKFVGKEVIHVERHTKCRCGCKIKAKDCNPYQIYKPDECRCACNNTDSEEKCYRNHKDQHWDPESCTCRCRKVVQCSTGNVYDGNSCKCVPIPVRRRNSEVIVAGVVNPQDGFYETYDFE